jgi:NAD+-dependent protein deacetylase sirtuin 4
LPSRTGCVSDKTGSRATQGEKGEVIQRPDGDVELKEIDKRFELPVCPDCQGFLKPDVVFFGDGVPAHKAQQATHAVAAMDSMLIVGTSVSTYSVYRLVKAAHALGKPVGAVNVGATRADELLTFKVEAVAGEAMMRLACHPSLLLPRPVR